MQGAAVATEVADRSKNVREIIFGRKIMDAVVEYGGWMAARPNGEELERIVDGIKKRTSIVTVGKNIMRIDYRDDDADRAYRVTQKFAELFIQESIAPRRPKAARRSTSSRSRRRNTTTS